MSRGQLPGLGWLRAAGLIATAAMCVAAAVVVLCVCAGRLINLTYPLGALGVGYWLATRATRAR